MACDEIFNFLQGCLPLAGRRRLRSARPMSLDRVRRSIRHRSTAARVGLAALALWAAVAVLAAAAPETAPAAKATQEWQTLGGSTRSAEHRVGFERGAELLGKERWPPRRWYGVIEHTYDSRTTDNAGSVTWHASSLAKAVFTLVAERDDGTNHDYFYRATGTVNASSSASGRCTLRGSRVLRLGPGPNDEGLEVSVMRDPRGRVLVGYRAALDSVNPYGRVHVNPGRDFHVNAVGTCDGDSSVIPSAVTWMGPQSAAWVKFGAQTLGGDRMWGSPDGWTPGSRGDGSRVMSKWCFVRKQSDLESCRSDELEAVARVSGSKLRAATQTLDGSGSEGDIKSYEWTFDRADCTGGPCVGYCDRVGPKTGAKKTGARVTIKPLCTIQATLTVTDGQDEDTDSVEVTVTPRSEGWRTRFFHRWAPTPAQRAHPLAPKDPPVVTCFADCTVELRNGFNAPDPKTCPGQELPESRIVCPLLSGKTTWNGRGYTLAVIADPGGPFDGYTYVKASTLTVRRIAYINPFLLSGPFYEYNKTHAPPAGQVDQWIEAVKQHEG